MRTFWITAFVLSLMLLRPCAASVDTIKPFELLDGDRVVFLGGTFFDREAELGYIETALTSQFPDRNVTFRNLGYGGDTVRCEARTVCEGWANFGPPEEGFGKLQSMIEELKPTVVFIAYGMGESFEGEAKLPPFIADYRKLMDMLVSASGATPRFVLIGPNFHEDLGRPLPDPKEHNKLVKAYSEAIAQLAAERSARFVDLFGTTSKHQVGPDEPPLTDNGIHLTPHGYWRVAESILDSLGEPGWEWNVDFDKNGKASIQRGATVAKVELTAQNLTFSATSRALPPANNPQPSSPAATGIHFLRAAPGKYVLSANGKKLTEFDQAESGGAGFFGGPDADQAEQLRKLIVEKNILFFNSWRHENDTYILGYRKHEQGRNAPELKDFAALAAEKDKEIAKLRVPQPVTYTLEKTTDAGK